MNPEINGFYQLPMTKTLKDYILNDMGFSATDKSIIKSLLEHNADSNFHYDNTNLPKAVFERHLKVINRVIIAELLRLSTAYIKGQKDLP